MDETDEPNPIQHSDLSVSLRSEPGASPGTIVIDPDAQPSSIRLVEYDSDRLIETDRADPHQLAHRMEGARGVLWIDLVGLGDRVTLSALGDAIGLHRLVLEDIVNVHQRPKCEEYGDRLFIVCRVPINRGESPTEQMSLFLGPGFLLTVREQSGDCLDPVRRRLVEASGRLRHRAADYLAYAVLDTVTDEFFPLLENLGERLENLETEALDSPSLRTLVRIRSVKRELMALRRIVWPLRELFNAMMRGGAPGITEDTRVYLRDCYDHSVQLLDITDNYRELATGLMDVYLSSTGNRMNEIMKVLTIVSTIFIPLTFIAGVYGMNFDGSKSPWNMPELAWRFGYPACVLLMFVMCVGMVVYFRRLGWIGSQSERQSSGR